MSLRSVLSICALSFCCSHARTRRLRSPPSRPKSTSSRSTPSSPTNRGTLSSGSRSTISSCSTMGSRRRSRRSRTSIFRWRFRRSFPASKGPLPVDVRSNQEPVSGRMYVIVLDDMNIDSIRTPVVRQHAREFVESYFGAGDIAAVTYTSGRADASQDFTSDAQLLLASIDKFIGRGVRSSAMEAASKYYEDRLTLDNRSSRRCETGEHSSSCCRHAGQPDAHARHKREADRRSHRFRSRASASSPFSTRFAR